MKVKLGMMVLAGVFTVAFAHAEIIATNNTFTGSSSIAGWYNAGAVNAVIGYSSGAGPRQDWADNNDAVVQSPLSTGDTLPAGGTITGDGLLADGGLLIDVQDATRWNESAAFTIGGTMELGEEINFSFNSFNEKSGYQASYGQLWNKTDNVRIAQTGSSVWVVADTETAYTPLDVVLSYTAQASDVGDVLEIRIMDHATSATRDIYIDNFSVTTSIPEPATLGMIGAFGAVIIFVRKRLMI